MKVLFLLSPDVESMAVHLFALSLFAVNHILGKDYSVAERFADLTREFLGLLDERVKLARKQLRNIHI